MLALGWCSIATAQPNRPEHWVVSSKPLTTGSSHQRQVMDAPWLTRSQWDQFEVYGTVRPALLEPKLHGLQSLPSEIQAALQIRVSDAPIHIVVLEDRAALDQYASRILADAPKRRAMYIRHRGPGLVLTYFHPDWLQDVRHECTHALLDSSGIELPLWHDEGLAEYFETDAKNPLQHQSHRKAVQSQLRFGQFVDVPTLERLSSTDELDGKGYRDAWSVVAFMLNGSLDKRTGYQTYLQELQDKSSAGYLSHRMQLQGPEFRTAFAAFFRSIEPARQRSIK
jgi:hypothetical protein